MANMIKKLLISIAKPIIDTSINCVNFLPDMAGVGCRRNPTTKLVEEYLLYMKYPRYCTDWGDGLKHWRMDVLRWRFTGPELEQAANG
jgi:hypothetical protein